MDGVELTLYSSMQAVNQEVVSINDSGILNNHAVVDPLLWKWRLYKDAFVNRKCGRLR